jgi:hypothetical protein
VVVAAAADSEKQWRWGRHQRLLPSAAYLSKMMIVHIAIIMMVKPSAGIESFRVSG